MGTMEAAGAGMPGLTRAPRSARRSGTAAVDRIQFRAVARLRAHLGIAADPPDARDADRRDRKGDPGGGCKINHRTAVY
jgi:hypothetical protein